MNDVILAKKSAFFKWGQTQNEHPENLWRENFKGKSRAKTRFLGSRGAAKKQVFLDLRSFFGHNMGSKILTFWPNFSRFWTLKKVKTASVRKPSTLHIEKSKSFRRENAEFRRDLAEKKVKFFVADCTAEWRVPAAKKVKCVGRRLHTGIQCFGGEKSKIFWSAITYLDSPFWLWKK